MLPSSTDPEGEGQPSPVLAECRRLTGPNLMHAAPGAVIDVPLADSLDAVAVVTTNDALVKRWHRHAMTIAVALGWRAPVTTQRIWPGGASLFLSAPVDQLMTATEICEAAWRDAVDDVAAPSPSEIARLRDVARAEARPALVHVWEAAQRRALNVTFDEEYVSIGSGAGVQVWPIDELPDVDAIDWPAISDIPIVLVTGSNGKTTVVRMVAAMARAAGHTVGYTCTDGVWIGAEQVESGDWSGPIGARRVLRDSSVTLAVLETARGGLLRRGLAVQHAAVAAIVTLSPDHFGDYGITDLVSLADAKLVVRRAVEARGTLVYNADVAELATALAAYSGRVVPVSIDATNSFRTETQGREEKHEGTDGNTNSHSSRGSPWLSASVRKLLPRIELSLDELQRIPATRNGAARHNVLNAMIAIEIANALDLGQPARDALLRFGADPGDNVGRLMQYDIAGVTVVIDYAHNAQGVAALIDATRHLPAMRRAIALGTGGDRDDVALQGIAQAAVQSGIIDRYIAKEMPRFLRGRTPGSISGVLLHALRAAGVADEQLVRADDDLSAVRSALEWSRSGDLLLLATHDQRDAVLALLAACTRAAWQPGQPLPQ